MLELLCVTTGYNPQCYVCRLGISHYAVFTHSVCLVYMAFDCFLFLSSCEMEEWKVCCIIWPHCCLLWISNLLKKSTVWGRQLLFCKQLRSSLSSWKLKYVLPITCPETQIGSLKNHEKSWHELTAVKIAKIFLATLVAEHLVSWSYTQLSSPANNNRWAHSWQHARLLKYIYALASVDKTLSSGYKKHTAGRI